jgi:hypothetical protein
MGAGKNIVVFFIGVVMGLAGTIHGSPPLIIAAAGLFFLLLGIIACSNLFITADNTGKISTGRTILVKPNQRFSTALALWLIVVLLGLLLLVGWYTVLNTTEPVKWFTWPILVIFTALAVVMFYRTMHVSMGLLRFGYIPLLVYVNNPDSPRIIKARMRISRHQDLIRQISGRLVCQKLEWKKQQSGKGRDKIELSVSEHWQAEKRNFPVNRSGMVEFLFEIPPELPGTSGSTDMEYTEGAFGKVFYAWELQVNADMPGVDLVRDYEVPVAAAS